MKLVSLRIGMPKKVIWRGQELVTGIFKDEVSEPVWVSRTGIQGDGQADREHHGGELKAVYAYGAEEYPFWRNKLGRPDLAYGSFGENLTIDGLHEEQIALGDRLQIGAAVLEAIQPRQPCSKLNIILNDPEMVKKFWEHRRWGVYFRVFQEGELRPGDEPKWIHRVESRFSLPKLMEVLKFQNPKRNDIEAVCALAGFPEVLKAKARARLQQAVD